MEEPKSLDSLFKEKIFRIPDYQRGYAWRREQLKARGIKLLKFMEERWNFCFKNDEDREKLLFLNFEEASE